jgi:hypothetical protein
MNRDSFRLGCFSEALKVKTNRTDEYSLAVAFGDELHLAGMCWLAIEISQSHRAIAAMITSTPSDRRILLIRHFISNLCLWEVL